MSVKTVLFVIDPQRDFCLPTGSLYVNGAEDDMRRLSAFVYKNRKKLFDIHVTLDSHHRFQIFHPLFWRDVTGNHPPAFTRITQDDIEKGIWAPAVPAMRDRVLSYVKGLAVSNRYQLVIWPVHCLIGSEGTQVTPELFKELCAWEDETIGMVNYVTKGSNLYTEHYSAVKAEVPDPADSSTQLNQQLVDLLTEADIILVAGEALDYCVYNSIKDVASAFGVDNTRKIKILEDCTSAIDPNAITKIKQEFAAMGIEFVTTDYFDK